MVPVTMGNYQTAVEDFMKKKLHTPKAIYIFVMAVTHLLSSILSMGTVPIVISVLGDSIKQRVNDYQQFSGKAITRAFTLGTLWAPGAATIFLISTVTKVKWNVLFLPCIILGILGLFLAYFLESRQDFFKKPQRTNNSEQAFEQSSKGQSLIPVLVAIAGLLILSFIFMHFNIGSSMNSVTLAGIITIGVWIVLLLLPKNSRQEHSQSLNVAVKEYLNNGVFSGASLAPFFIGIGTFTYGFEHSVVSAMLIQFLKPIFSQLGWALVVLIPLIVVLSSLVGIHPLASVALIGKIVMSAHLVLSPLLIALSLNIGSVIAYMVSPFAGIIIIVASLLEVKPTTISLRWNWLFCLLFAAVGLTFSVLFSFIY